ncbi:type II toxin-antitoxin system VapC family toxin [Burkholderiaceae bacterium UC74_6]
MKKITPRLQGDHTEVYFSVASLREIAIKSGIGKLEFQAAEVRRAALGSGLLELSVLGARIKGLTKLPEHHPAPFDRLLVAHAAAEPVLLLTADEKVALYGDHHVELI